MFRARHDPSRSKILQQYQCAARSRGGVMVGSEFTGKARRPLMAFVIVLGYPTD